MKDSRPLQCKFRLLSSQSWPACENKRCLVFKHSSQKRAVWSKSQSNTHCFEEMLLCSAKPVNPSLKAFVHPQPLLFLKKILPPPHLSKLKQDFVPNMKMDRFQVSGFLIYFTFIFIYFFPREWSCWEVEKRCWSSPAPSLTLGYILWKISHEKTLNKKERGRNGKERG